MRETHFYLPGSGYPQLEDILRVYYNENKYVNATYLETVYKIGRGNVSRNHKFLMSIGILEGSRLEKRLTPFGMKLGFALVHGEKDETGRLWSKLIEETEFFQTLLSSIQKQNPIILKDFKNAIYRISGKNPKNETLKLSVSSKTIIDILETAGYTKFEYIGRFKSYRILSRNPKQETRSVKLVNPPFVDLERLSELRLLRSEHFDLSRVIKLCEETNVCFGCENYYATIVLLRALIDHIPPIFGFNDFSQIANHHSGRSFKSIASRLDKSLRKIADDSVHSQIRKSEVLLNKTTVNFSSDIDVLLSEIVRILKRSK